ncbi:hypothetical protein AXA84_0117 [Candidatus Phytoplasma oryzae]|uniref:Uncharacterized protein n=1 Tax=Candidatus Phytoplasma oryzae TaxID=203274 RepID=A0A139JR59_9MOLU|nr:hypothetical protein [Candidatus Phytoplasma oryzae]KXT29471.1 hypothetical protein AXA84_0117 [Candidatus Phytoplasma oryzae]RAM58049.1 hypothetical protein DH96_00670 [Candidatus Phytoplasma oryzae]
MLTFIIIKNIKKSINNSNLITFKNKISFLYCIHTYNIFLLTGFVWNLIASPDNELAEIKNDFFTINLSQRLYVPLFYVIFYFLLFMFLLILILVLLYVGFMML